MPREERRIIFGYTETYKAMLALSVQKKLARPVAGTISGIALKAGDDKSLVITFTNKTNGKSAKCEYSRDFLAEALIGYCRICRIPFPRKKARKSVEPGREDLTLRITM
jgi:hypothetical protein